MVGLLGKLVGSLGTSDRLLFPIDEIPDTPFEPCESDLEAGPRFVDVGRDGGPVLGSEGLWSDSCGLEGLLEVIPSLSSPSSAILEGLFELPDVEADPA